MSKFIDKIVDKNKYLKKSHVDKIIKFNEYYKFYLVSTDTTYILALLKT